jgi:hypothetical protein
MIQMAIIRLAFPVTCYCSHSDESRVYLMLLENKLECAQDMYKREDKDED